MQTKMVKQNDVMRIYQVYQSQIVYCILLHCLIRGLFRLYIEDEILIILQTILMLQVIVVIMENLV